MEKEPVYCEKCDNELIPSEIAMGDNLCMDCASACDCDYCRGNYAR